MPTFDSQVKFQKIPVVELVVQQAATPGPTSPIVGQLWWDTTNGQLKVCTNATGPVWTQCDNVTGGTASNVSDGDKGEITVTSGVWTIDAAVVTAAKLAAILKPTTAGGTATYADPALRTLGYGATEGLPGNTSFSELSQNNTATGQVMFGNQQATFMADPQTQQAGATKNYVDINWPKQYVRVASSANVATLSGAQTVDGVACVSQDRVLLKNQTTQSQNGVWTVSNSAWTRSLDFDTSAKASGAMVSVREGTNAGTVWMTTFRTADTIGTTNMLWYQVINSGNTSFTPANVSDGDKGDLTVASGVWTIDANTVGYSKMAPIGAYRLIGNGTGASANPMDVPLVVDMDISSGALSVAAWSGGDLTKAAGSRAPTITNGAVTVAKLATAVTLNAIASANLATAGVNFNAQQINQVANPTLNTDGANKQYVDARRLDQIATSAPATAAVSLNSQKITNLADPTLGQDAATKAYVDTMKEGLDPKASVKAATTANITLSGTPQTIDGISCTAADRVLVKNQTNAQDNGIYLPQAGAWVRTVDLDQWSEVPGAFTWVEQGTVNADTGWVSTADQGGTLNTTAMPWVQFSGAGSITDGIGLLKTGNTLDVRLDNSTIEAPSDILQVKDLGITAAKLANGSVDLAGTKITGNLGTGNGGTGAPTITGARTNLAASGAYTATSPVLTAAGTWYPMAHTLGQRARDVTFEVASTGDQVVLDWRVTSGTPLGSIDIRTDITGSPARAAGYYNVTVYGSS